MNLESFSAVRGPSPPAGIKVLAGITLLAGLGLVLLSVANTLAYVLAGSTPVFAAAPLLAASLLVSIAAFWLFGSRLSKRGMRIAAMVSRLAAVLLVLEVSLRTIGVPENFDAYGVMFGALGVLAALMLLIRARAALLLTATFWCITLGVVLASASRKLHAALGLSTAEGEWSNAILNAAPGMINFDPEPALGPVLDGAMGLVAIILLTAFSYWALRSADTREWVAIPVGPSEGIPARGVIDRRAVVRPLLLGALLYAAFFGLGILYIVPFDNWPDPIADFIFSNLPPVPDVALLILGYLLPIGSALALVLWGTTERLRIDDNGVRLFLYHNKYTMFNAPWSRISRVDVIRHKRRLPSYIIRYRSRFGLPFSLGVHCGRYADGAAVAEAIEGGIAAAGKPTREFMSPEWKVRAAWVMIAFGALLVLGQQLYSALLMREIALERIKWGRLSDYLGLMTLPTIYLASIAAFGVGLGLLSAYHRGGPRLLLMALWMQASLLVPGPILHWLVWIASYAIMTARLQPVETLPWIPAPTEAQWELAFVMLSLGPLVAGLSYLLGVHAGRRPSLPHTAPQASHAPAPTPEHSLVDELRREPLTGLGLPLVPGGSPTSAAS